MDLEHDCTINCKLLQHGDIITNVLTKREIDEEKLIKYLILSCRNFLKIADSKVRGAIFRITQGNKILLLMF